MILDKHNEEVIIGNAYQYIFAWPGPDITLLIAKSFTEDNKVLCYDCNFNFELTVNPTELFQRIGTWSEHEMDLVKNNNGNYQQILDHNEGVKK